MMMRRPRLRLTIAGIMGVVACTAVVLECLVDAVRIRRAQAFYLRESAKYAQLESRENQNQSFYLQAALLENNLIDHLRQIESDRRESMRDHFYAPLRIVPDTERYKINFERGRKYLARLAQSRIKAKRYSELSRRYKTAGTGLWLPFGQNPLNRSD
jgi:hypothetical protein